MIRVTDFVEQLHLTELTPSNRRQWNIVSADYNRPGLQFAGFYNYFAWERPQVIGKVEMTYLSQMTPEERAAMYERYFSYDIPCIICCRERAVLRSMKGYGRQLFLHFPDVFACQFVVHVVLVTDQY